MIKITAEYREIEVTGMNQSQKRGRWKACVVIFLCEICHNSFFLPAKNSTPARIRYATIALLSGILMYTNLPVIPSNVW